jgi:hypothetical protein
MEIVVETKGNWLVLLTELSRKRRRPLIMSVQRGSFTFNLNKERRLTVRIFVKFESLE